MRVIFNKFELFARLRKPDLPFADSSIRHPWLFEAPLHAVKIYEAVLGRYAVPAHTEPLKVWTSPAGLYIPCLYCDGKLVQRSRRRLDNYIEQDVSYVLLSKDESATLEKIFRPLQIHGLAMPHLLTPFGTPVGLFYWSTSFDHEQVIEKYKWLLQRLNIPPTQPLSRSLLPAEAKPFSLKFESAMFPSIIKDCTEWPYNCVYGTCERDYIQWTEEQLNASCTTVELKAVGRDANRWLKDVLVPTRK